MGSKGDAASVDDFVRPFEAAWARDGAADLARFLPPPEHPLRHDALVELVCVDLEFGWQHGRPRPLPLPLSSSRHPLPQRRQW